MKKLKNNWFSHYIGDLKKKLYGNRVVVEDKEWYNRVNSVLRMTHRDKVQLIDGLHKCIASVENKTKNTLNFILDSDIEDVKANKTQIQLNCGLLKKENMEEVCRFCGSIGIETIQPIITQKVQKMWMGQK